MKISNPSSELLKSCTEGEMGAIDQVLRSIEPGIHHLALRMLGRREDAADATQEILLKVVTHLGGFRGEAQFSTWVFRIARNHLMHASTKLRESPEVSFEALAGKLQAGLDFAQQVGGAQVERSLTPEDKASAKEVALGCIQGMLMALAREHRMAYVLDLLFGLPSSEAAQVLEISPEAYRQRLARARERLEGFAARQCGCVNSAAACRCDRQLPSLRASRVAADRQRDNPSASPAPAARRFIPLKSAEDTHRAAQAFDALVRLGDAAALFHALPDPQPPGLVLETIRGLLRAEGLGVQPGPLH
jgi:RNA polymerase sigma factor (sigma-70 family)